ncbi:MAG: bifunctional (p)ppGpp synthetase/guanosine-3',5'-bis(diphosphate) 3'-pyrophosphohydrolase [Lachnospiraceae bacterium]|nr:bifunctional (p)ppGpp synthetase/guanosine-3',5'-bis(diphosphate) 3'-pyrophosphohydrolase [Lachnospiraceae bacterium]MBQ2401865.1 bifunctional (p)ppGpp synthetase/guanosine-3',5'-bis(diphosphate) 3'-pyrophosphohydrolase [Lachnospiraceae bacterium]MBQ5806324.1 bifunctional (p)ppGpp synthetase/guanosine-3',5'-bis(diphosphate) 3'-pyrophosphohydrolase [Lachnospiraceae bacterium]MBQ5915971.1 bifunctional (p)ppGpp synthetase/guanosine-3',5'-bis(diphosphate) 3'-pyrophosphohydrolase [Lachnospiraceae 
MEIVSEAIIFAVKAHDGMRRKKSDAPYILHPMEAAVIVGTMSDDQELIAAAALHDVVEDTDITIEEIEEKFGKRIKELVASETEDKRADLPPAETWRIRKEESLEDLKNTDDIGVLMVWIGDKLANMRSIYREWKVEGDAMWQKFNQKNVSEQAWYYRSIAKLTERLSDTSAWIEYNALTELVFGKGE